MLKNSLENVPLGLKAPVTRTDRIGGALATSCSPKEDKKLRQVCQDFESVLLNYLLTKMRESVPKSEESDGNSAQIYRGMLDEEFAKNMAATGGVGLAAMLYESLSSALPSKSGQSGAKGAVLPTKPGGVSKELGHEDRQR